MKVVKRIFFSHIFFFVLTTALILTLHLTPFFVFWRHTPSDRVFSFVHNNIQDFYFYQSLMQQGANGGWLTRDPYTLEPHQPSIVFAYFLWLGKFSRMLSIPFPFMYHFIRVLFGLATAIAAYILIRLLRLSYPRLAYLFFLFASPFLYNIAQGGGVGKAAYMYWWTGIDAIRRFAYLPHHMFGSLILIINVIALLQFVKSLNRKWFILSIICALLLGFVHPPSLFILLIALPVASFCYFIKLISDRKNPKSIFQHLPLFGLLVYWFIGLFLIIFMVSQTNKGFPWSQYIAWERQIQFPLNKELIGALGILLPFALVGGISALLSGEFSSIFVTSWLFAPFALIPFALKLNISNIRLIQGTPFLPLAILAVWGIQAVEKKAVLLLSTRTFQLVTRAGVILLFLYFTIPTLAWSMKDQINEYWNIWSNVYLDKRLFPAFDFINSHYSSKTNALATFYTGNYLSAFTPVNSFMGHFGYTYNREKKEKEADIFFKNEMPDPEAKQFIVNNRITLIFQGVEEKPLSKSYLYPGILKPVYDKDGLTVYEIKG